MQENTTESTLLTEMGCDPDCQEKLGLFKEQLAAQWGWIALRGALAIVFGLLAVIWPLAAVWTLAVLFGAFALADGIVSFVTGWQLYKKGVRWWPYMLFGVIGVLAGLVTFVWPGITALMLLYLIAFWAIFAGASEIAAAIRLRKEIEGEWLLGLAGVISILFGLFILLRPVPEGVVAIAWLVGLYAITMGIVFVMLALKVRRAR